MPLPIGTRVRFIAPAIFIFLVLAQVTAPAQSEKSKGETRKLKASVQQLLDKAEQGDAEAQFEFGMMHYKGEDIVQKSSKSDKSTRKVAKQGNSPSRSSMDVFDQLWIEGEKRDQEYLEAAKWFRKAAKQGYALAQFYMGKIYDYGLGVPRDGFEAAKWYRKAAEKGSLEAKFSLGVLYRRGRSLGGDIRQDISESAKWFLKAAEQGHSEAQFNLGMLYIEGKGLLQDFIESEKWIRKAAVQGHSEAQFNLGKMYHKALGLAQDIVMAHMWYNLAAAEEWPGSAKERDAVAENMTPAQIAEAQKMAREWKPKKHGMSE